MRIFAYSIFFGLVSLIACCLHYYFWMRLVRDPSWPQLATQLGKNALIAIAVLLPITMMLLRFVPRSLATPLAWVSYVWMGLAFYLLISLLSADLLRVLTDFLLGLGSEPKIDADRRLLFARVGAGVAALASGTVTILSLRGATDIQVEEIEVHLDRLPKALDGFSIVQLSDIHIGPILGRRFIEEIVEITNRLKPDLIAITGDLVDGSVAELKDQVAPLATLKARHGSFFITGNHEYYSGAAEWIKEIRSLGITPLQNEHRIISDGDASFTLAGVNDYTAGRFDSESAPSVTAAIKHARPDQLVVLLAHQPKEIDNAALAGVDLQLSGHTHGGQIWPFGHLVSLNQPYLAGLYQHNEKTQIYVNSGTGFWGPPMRLGTSAEITKLILRSS
jgi:predicted MPP superfamily phosphohydrolase